MSHTTAPDEDDDDLIEEEQLEEYREMVEELGAFPDKVKINSLSAVAEDFADSKKNAEAIYDCLRQPLVSPSIDRDRKIPLVYAIDSIVKNVKGQYVSIVEQDAKKWMPLVYDVLGTRQRDILKKVWNIWRQEGVFAESAWKEMGTCFTNSGMARLAAGDTGNSIGGIKRLADGTLQLSPSLRKQMQALLDEAQSEVVNELEKVSLERLAEINPELLMNLKKEAETIIIQTKAAVTGSIATNGTLPPPQLPPYLIETRSQFTLQRTKDWMKEWQKPSLDSANIRDLASKLDDMVNTLSTSGNLYTQNDAIQMTNSLGAMGAVSVHLSQALKSLEDLQNKQASESDTILQVAPTVVGMYRSLDRSKFTNEGIKKRDPTAIACLYEVGLPFVSSVDGRRFRTQVELSHHLDFLFKKNQLEKSMERTEERGWFIVDNVWTGEAKAAEVSIKQEGVFAEVDGSEPKDKGDADPSTFTVPADETQDRCAICDINFKMVFDNDEGIYKYTNCKEITVVMDDVAMDDTEQRLVHVTCWRGLGSPQELTMDQVLERTGH